MIAVLSIDERIYYSMLHGMQLYYYTVGGLAGVT